MRKTNCFAIGIYKKDTYDVGVNFVPCLDNQQAKETSDSVGNEN